MRKAAMCIWGMNLPQEEFIEAITQETVLTNCNQIAVDFTVAYCLMVRHLIKNPMENVEALDIATKYAEKVGNKEVQEHLTRV